MAKDELVVLTAHGRGLVRTCVILLQWGSMGSGNADAPKLIDTNHYKSQSKSLSYCICETKGFGWALWRLLK
jgi:hypothetical protein